MERLLPSHLMQPPLLLLLLLTGHSKANEDHAAKISANLRGSAASGAADADSSTSTAIAWSRAGTNPLAVSREDFSQMYEDNKDLWGDMDQQSAHINYQRSMSGNVDSARLLMEFSMVPSVKSGGTDLHKAAAAGDVEKVAALTDVESGTSIVDPTKADGATPLIIAAMAGQSRVVELLLDQGADPEKVGINGATPLMIAASMGHVEVMERLLDADANADAAHKFAKSTAMHFAVEMGQVEAVRLLCRRGANPEASKIQGGRPLHVAADSNQSEAAAVLVKECKADTNALLLGDTTPMYLAAQKGFIEVVRVLLEAGSDTEFVMPETPVGSAIAQPTTGHPLPDTDETEEDRMARYFRGMTQKGSDPTAPGFEAGNGATALHAAVENGHIDTVQLLLDHGVQQTGSMEGATPLILAAMYNQHKIAPLLIKAGAKLNDKVPKTGNTAMYHAVGSGYADFVEVLIAAGADLEASNNGGVTPLLYACSIGRTRLLERLLDAGANASARANDGSSCLHVAADRGILHTVTSLFRKRPMLDVDMLDDEGQAALHAACQRHSLEIVKLLLQVGADVNRRVISTGATPLMMAARAGRDPIVQLLLDRGADIHMKGNHRMYQANALHLAAQGGFLDVIKRLLDAGARIDSRLTLGVTPLFAAAERGHASVVEHLLEAGASVGMKNVHGATAMYVAAAGQHVAVIRLLAKAGARVNTRTRKGDTPLHLAVREGKSAVAAALLEVGADPTIADDDGSSAADIARKKRDFDLVKLLGKHAAERSASGRVAAGKESKSPDSVTEAEGTEEEEEEPPQVVMVSRVKFNGDLYLVDKRTGIVYSNDLDNPEQIGSWSESGGVKLGMTKVAGDHAEENLDENENEGEEEENKVHPADENGSRDEL